MRTAGAVLTALLAFPALVSGQDVRTAVVPDSILVGDVFRVAVQVTVAGGTVVEFPDTLAVPANVEAAARRAITVDSAADGRVSHTAVYPLAAWRPGPVELPPARIRVAGPQGRSSEVEAQFRPILIATVLPTDTTQIEPKPARDVIGSSRLIWPFALAILLLLAAAAGAFWAYRRRRPQSVAGPAVPPRVAALAELDRIRKLGYLERGEYRAFYTAVAAALRGYTSRLDARWGVELTTTELWRAMVRAIEQDWQATVDSRTTGSDEPAVAAEAPAGSVEPGTRPTLTGGARRQPVSGEGGSNDAQELYSMLGRADLVKFARARPEVAEAHAVWTEARRWVEQFPPPDQDPESTEVEA